MEWDEGGGRRGGDDTLAELALEVRALSKTVIEMHRENLQGAETRRDALDGRLGQMADAMNALALAVQKADSALSQELAVHIATAHHAGTLERLNSHEVRLDGHDAALDRIRQRLQTEEGRQASESEHRDRRILIWGLVIAGSVGMAQTVAQLVGSAWQTLATLFTGRGS